MIYLDIYKSVSLYYISFALKRICPEVLFFVSLFLDTESLREKTDRVPSRSIPSRFLIVSSQFFILTKINIRARVFSLSRIFFTNCVQNDRIVNRDAVTSTSEKIQFPRVGDVEY